MKTRYILILLICSIPVLVYGQDNCSFFSRLQGISKNGVDFFNIDGIEITSQKIESEFTKKNIETKFPQLNIKEKELVNTDSLIETLNFHVFKSFEKPKGFFSNMSYYFVESSDKKLVAFTFSSVNKVDTNLEHKFIKLSINNAIPRSIYSSANVDSINFAGRKISLGSSCWWMGINNVHCEFYGQMNWSVHEKFDDAKHTVNDQFLTLKYGKKGKIVCDTTVNIVFEGTQTTAKRIIFKITGFNSILSGMTGGKSLTVYYVAAPVRNNFVSCVMSFWNNDQINPSGLPPLLEQIMKLK